MEKLHVHFFRYELYVYLLINQTKYELFFYWSIFSLSLYCVSLRFLWIFFNIIEERGFCNPPSPTFNTFIYSLIKQSMNYFSFDIFFPVFSLYCVSLRFLWIFFKIIEERGFCNPPSPTYSGSANVFSLYLYIPSHQIPSHLSL